MADRRQSAVFYSSKPRIVIHMAINIAIAPVLLYLVGVWPWPPQRCRTTSPFSITGLIGIALRASQLARRCPPGDRRGRTALRSSFYPADESIYRGVQTVGARAQADAGSATAR